MTWSPIARMASVRAGRSHLLLGAERREKGWLQIFSARYWRLHAGPIKPAWRAARLLARVRLVRGSISSAIWLPDVVGHGLAVDEEAQQRRHAGQCATRIPCHRAISSHFDCMLMVVSGRRGGYRQRRARVRLVCLSKNNLDSPAAR